MQKKKLEQWAAKALIKISDAQTMYWKTGGGRCKPLATLAMFFLCMASTFAVDEYGISAEAGLGYVKYIILTIGLIMTIIMAISTGFAFKNDAASAKAQLIGTILIPVLISVVLYLFNKFGTNPAIESDL